MLCVEASRGQEGGAPSKERGAVVYLLRNKRAHYVGATLDLRRRIRQHNGEICGGARRTCRRGPGWEEVLHVSGFRTFRESLQFEFAYKRETRRWGDYTTQGRKFALEKLMRKERWTTNSPPALEVPLEVVIQA